MNIHSQINIGQIVINAGIDKEDITIVKNRAKKIFLLISLSFIIGFLIGAFIFNKNIESDKLIVIIKLILDFIG